MSRVGKKPIEIPKDVKVVISDKEVRVKGSKAELVRVLHPLIKVTEESDENGTPVLKVAIKSAESARERALWGTFRAHLANMIRGVTKGYEKQLQIEGVGYRVALQGKKFVFEVGFSHSVEFTIPEGIEAAVEKNVITLRGPDKELVGQTAAEIRSIRPPEPYKGKGIRYVGEEIRRKAGKAAKTAA